MKKAKLIDFVHRVVIFKNKIENRPVQFRKVKHGENYINALIKTAMNDLITLVYTEDNEIKEINFSADECLYYLKVDKYNNEFMNIKYTVDLKAGDTMYIKSSRWTGNALFLEKCSEYFRILYVKRENDANNCNMYYHEILSGEVEGEVFSHE